jgi:hypothetical protein
VYDDIDTLTRNIARLEGIIRANKLHEDYCPAFNPHKGDFANMFGSLLERECHCWIAPEAFPDETNKAIGIYEISTETILQGNYFQNRHAARNFILNHHADLVSDPKSERYWGKTFYIVPVTLTLANPERPIA